MIENFIAMIVIGGLCISGIGIALVFAIIRANTCERKCQQQAVPELPEDRSSIDRTNPAVYDGFDDISDHEYYNAMHTDVIDNTPEIK